MKESASKGEEQIAMLQSQFLEVLVNKHGQIFDILCEISAMVIQLADLQDQVSSIAEEKMLLEEKNTVIERSNRVSEKIRCILRKK